MLLSVPSYETHHLLHQAGMWYFSTEEYTCFCSQNTAVLFEDDTVMAKDQRWEATAGGSLGGDLCNQCGVLLSADPQGLSVNLGLKEDS